ncbi:MAG: MarR family transcriptional regulator [Crocinitomicaceae bacterium]|jgi:DNA-binding MarR family transcriptional regulator|nr:MarR family transcriptional regulator [Crocinitomicaceae bacterium]
MENEKKLLIDFVLRQTWHKVARMYNQKAAQIDITISIGFILMIIDKEGTPSTQLGPRMGMEPTSLSRTLKTMEEMGFLRREYDKVDKRKVLIFLTEAGIAKRKQTKEVILDFNNKLFAKISPTKFKTFIDVMTRIDTITEKELKMLNEAEK